VTEKIATRDAYGEILVELGKINKDIVVLDADLSKSTKTILFGKEFPERFFNMGIAEQNMMGTAAGLATCGKIPFASTFAMFATGRAFEQVRNTIAYPALNVKIAATHAGVTVGEDGGSHQSIEDIALMRVLPGMTVMVPADAAETRQAVKAAIAIDGPVYIRMGRSAVPQIFDETQEFRVGQAVRIKEGKQVAMITTGIMTAMAIEAAEMLANEGIEASVLHIHTIKPIDREAIRGIAEETGCIVTAEEHSIIGGLGGAVAEVLAETCPVPMVRVGIQDHFGESGTPADLLEKYELTSQGLVHAVKEVLDKKKELCL
jgi:transketolase